MLVLWGLEPDCALLISIGRIMKTAKAVQIFEALAAESRLEVFRLLVKNEPNGLVAGDIAKKLKIPPTTLSFHLKTIHHAGLVSVEKEGRFLRYRASIPLVNELIDYLTAEYCTADSSKKPVKK